MSGYPPILGRWFALSQLHRDARSLARFSGWAVLLGLLTWNTQAALVLTSTDATSPTHSYEGEIEPFSEDTSTLTFGNSTEHLRNYTSLSITLNAPAGQMFVVQSPPEGASEATLFFMVVFGGGGSIAPYANIQNASFAFSVVSGTAPSLFGHATSIPKTSGNQFDFSAFAKPTSGFSFTSLTYTFDYDNTGITDAPLGNFQSGSLRYAVNGLETDPGALMTLQAVPEPAGTGVIAVLLLGVVVVGCERRRRRQAARS